jgi:hypothetical protein
MTLTLSLCTLTVPGWHCTVVLHCVGGCMSAVCALATSFGDIWCRIAFALQVDAALDIKEEPGAILSSSSGGSINSPALPYPTRPPAGLSWRAGLGSLAAHRSSLLCSCPKGIRDATWGVSCATPLVSPIFTRCRFAFTREIKARASGGEQIKCGGRRGPGKCKGTAPPHLPLHCIRLDLGGASVSSTGGQCPVCVSSLDPQHPVRRSHTTIARPCRGRGHVHGNPSSSQQPLR